MIDQEDEVRCVAAYVKIKKAFPDEEVRLGYYDFHHGCAVSIGKYGIRLMSTYGKGILNSPRPDFALSYNIEHIQRRIKESLDADNNNN